ncbi:MAG: hypothetical protein HY719_06975 [Planctomycetes bacterium]|nr:hypothetical protein [Planctomycetota bacterium]
MSQVARFAERREVIEGKMSFLSERLALKEYDRCGEYIREIGELITGLEKIVDPAREIQQKVLARLQEDYQLKRKAFIKQTVKRSITKRRRRKTTTRRIAAPGTALDSGNGHGPAGGAEGNGNGRAGHNGKGDGNGNGRAKGGGAGGA